MAGLGPANHVVRRVKRSQARAMLVSDPSVAPRGVDGRDKPGHDGRAKGLVASGGRISW
jgi:hypothetical protein